MPESDPTSRVVNLSEPAPGPVQLTEPEETVLWMVSSLSAVRYFDGRVEWLVDGADIACLLELGATIAARHETPAVWDRIAFRLGWTPDWGDDQDQHQNQDAGASAPEADGEAG